MKDTAQRNEQFENITHLKTQYAANGNPVIRMDTKKKENLGNFYREGKVYSQQAFQTYDHDFASFAEGALFPMPSMMW